MAKIPTSTQTSLWQRLTSHASQRWPQIRRINTRYRAGFAYIDAVVDEETIRLCRLATEDQPTNGASPSTGPATTTTRTPTYPPATRSEPVKRPSTPPAGSTSTTQPPGPHPRRTNRRDH